MTPIEDLTALSPNAKAALRRANLNTLEEAVELSDEALLRLKGMGAESLARLRRWQADPLAPQPSGTTREEKERSERIWQLYLTLRQQGTQPVTAMNAAIEEADQLSNRLRGAA